MEALKKDAPLRAVNGNAAMSLGALYDSAMELAFWQRYAGDDSGAMATVASGRGTAGGCACEERRRGADCGGAYALWIAGSWLPEVKVLQGAGVACGEGGD